LFISSIEVLLLLATKDYNSISEMHIENEMQQAAKKFSKAIDSRD
jgi:L-serine deaminase